MPSTRFSLRSLFIGLTLVAFFFSTLVSLLQGSAWGTAIWSTLFVFLFVQLFSMGVYWLAVGVAKVFRIKAGSPDSVRDYL